MLALPVLPVVQCPERATESDEETHDCDGDDNSVPLEVDDAHESVWMLIDCLIGRLRLWNPLLGGEGAFTVELLESPELIKLFCLSFASTHAEAGISLFTSLFFSKRRWDLLTTGAGAGITPTFGTSLSLSISIGPSLLLSSPLEAETGSGLWPQLFTPTWVYCIPKSVRPCVNYSRHSLPLASFIILNTHKLANRKPRQTHFVSVISYSKG